MTLDGKIFENINNIISDNELKGILCLGKEYFRYLTGTTLPFPEYYPEKKIATIYTPDYKGIILPPEWEQAIIDQGWKENVHTYNINQGNNSAVFLQTLEKVFKENKIEKSKIGYDSINTPVVLLQELRKKIPHVQFVSIDEDLNKARITKNVQEIELIQKSCKYTDRGIINALNHLEGTLDGFGYTIPEYVERVRVHVFEAGGSGVGDLLVTFGSNTQFLYSPHRGRVKDRVLFRTDVSSQYLGYWSNLGRMGFTGEPTKQYEDAYKENRELKNQAKESITPGTRCSKIYKKIKDEADRNGTILHSEILGHGVGVTQYEAPFITPYDNTELQKGMVVSLDISTIGPKNEIIHDKDIYEITSDGCRKLSNYRDWEKIYAVTGFRAVH
jgi:Xaa-Pro aminopeptidase